MSTIKRIAASFLAFSIGGTAALAQVAGNEARLDVSASPDGSSVTSLSVTQAPNSQSRITQAPRAGAATLGQEDFDYYAAGQNEFLVPAGSIFGGNAFIPPIPATDQGPILVYPDNGRGQISGSYQSVVIEQGPGANNLAVNIGGQADSTTATVELKYDGDGNEHVLRAGNILGTGAPNATISANVDGDGNDIRDNIIVGGDGTLSYDLDIINGDNNVVRLVNGNPLGSSELTYTNEIEGSNNVVDVDGGTLINGSRTLTLIVDGDNNNIDYDANAVLNATLTGEFTGDDINADLVQQLGDNQTATLAVTNEAGATALDFTMTQNGFNQSVDATVTHLAGGAGAGSFTITQSLLTFGATYVGSTVLAGGGVGAVSQ